MLLVYALCCLPLLAKALTPGEQAEFSSGCYPGCNPQSPCPDVSLTTDTDRGRPTLNLRSNGVPNHEAKMCNENEILYNPNPKRIKIPNLNATESEKFFLRTDPKYCTPNIVGYAKNGIPFYSGNNTDCNRNDPIEIIFDDEGNRIYMTFDSCGGHATAKGQYHYHCNPSCLSSNTDNQFLGVAVDGFPIYGSRVRALGREARNTDLDECHGKNFNDGLGYRYIINNEYPYTVGCLRGDIEDSVECPNEQLENRLCLCSGGYDDQYGGGSNYGKRRKRGAGGSRRRRSSRRRGGRGGSSRRGGRRDRDTEALVFQSIGRITLGDNDELGQCVEAQTCEYQPFVDRHETSSEDNNNNNNGNIPPVPGQPDIIVVPVPGQGDTELSRAMGRLQAFVPSMMEVKAELEQNCYRWCNWMMWNNGNCLAGRRFRSDFYEDYCERADDNLDDTFINQLEYQEKKPVFDSLKSAVINAGGTMPFSVELPDWCTQLVIPNSRLEEVYTDQSVCEPFRRNIDQRNDRNGRFRQ